MASGWLGCALIGPGNFGRGLARALCEDQRVRFVGVLGATPAESIAGAAELGGRAYASIAELLPDAAVQAVLIATPSDTHAALAIAAAQAGKHVFVEKPMALTVAECDAMIAAAASTTLMIGQLQRFFPLLAEVRERVHAQQIGQPLTTLMWRHDMLQRAPGSWLQQRARVGGLLHQSCVHEIDWLRTVHGEVAHTSARLPAVPIQAGLDFPDAAELCLTFASGTIATLSACMTSYLPAHGGVIHGTHGTIRFDLLAGSLAWHTASGERGHHQREAYTVQAGHRVATRIELRAFVDAALGLAAPTVPGSEGRANVAVIAAALALAQIS